MASSGLNGNEASLSDQVSLLLRKDILGHNQPSVESLIIFRLVNGHISPHRAAIGLLATIARIQAPSKLLLEIAIELASLVAKYPVLHPHLIALISAIYRLPSSTSQRSEFLSSFSQNLGDFAEGSYGNLFDNKSPDLITEHEAINGFYARLLNAVGDWQIPEEVIADLHDALFIVSGAMENEPTVHGNPDIDVPSAAMYMIHASKFFFEESKRWTGQTRAHANPLWSVRGKLWDGDYGLSINRWRFWKIRFEFYAFNPKVQEETRYFAGMAVNTMNEVDHKESW